MSSESPDLAGRRRQVWGRRKGPTLSPRQKELLERLLPELTLKPEAGCDPRTYFSSPVTDVWFEIGFGAGEHLIWQAQANPAIGIIGAEPYVSGMAKLLSKIAAPSGSPLRGSPPPPQAEEEKEGARVSSPVHGRGAPKGGGGGAAVYNIRLYQEDARDIIGALPDASLGRVFILFPDPWPKTRHHKRRFIQMPMLDALARVLREGAELRFATDDPSYLTWALERLMAHPSFAWLARTAADWRARPMDWPETRYEAKAIKDGRPCTYLRFQRVRPC